MTDKQRHQPRVRRVPAASLPNWVIVLMAASVALAAAVARQLA
ncbi:hypothetical protein [Methylibium rhizosphaerae]|nr:hypothetical protein [Methylibium rhizosphaerae]